MAASDPAGGQKFWFNGVPYQGVNKPGTDTLGLKYWFNGVPVSTVIPATGPLPFNQIDWSKPFRLIGAPPAPHGLNPNLFTNPFPLKQAYSSPTFFSRSSAPPDQPYNLALYTVTVAAALPFNQTDWAKPHRVVNSLPDASRSLNPNLQKNPVPFNQTDWEKRVRVPHITPDASVSLNPNLQKNNVPNNQTDWEKPRRVRSEPPTPSVSLNPNLQKNNVPFNQTDWSKPARVRHITPDSSVSLNLNLATAVAALPFNQTDWATSRRLVGETQVPDGLNPNLFTNPVPFNQVDWSKPQQIRITQPQPQSGLNINLFTNPLPVVNLAPAAPFTVRASPAREQPYNLNLYGVVAVTLPFNQLDFAKPFFPRALPLPSDPLNINLFTNPVPFNQTDWSRPANRFTQPFPQVGLNINLFTNPVPFGAADSGARRLASLTPPDQPYNVALYTVTVVAAPFNQSDFAVTSRPRASAAPPSVFNPSLSTNDMPFSQFHYPPARRVPAAPIDLSRGQPNPNIFTNPMPFLQPAIGIPMALPRAPRLDTINVALLGTPIVTALPFNQYNFTPARRSQPSRPHDLLNLTLLASPVSPSSGRPHSKPFFATPGTLMGI